LSSPPGLKDHLLSPQEMEAIGTFPSPQIESSQHQQQSQLPQQDGEKQEKKVIRKLPSGKRDDAVSNELVQWDTIFSGPEDPGPRDPNWHAHVYYCSLEPR